MAKGRRELSELAARLDLFIETRDARAPASTSSPDAAALAKLKPVVAVLAKKDLADPEKTKIWLKGRTRYAFDLRRDGLGPLKKEMLRLKPAHRELRVGVVGIPNVGKSMLLNSLVGGAAAKVGGVPGVTRGVGWYRGNGFLVVDSPGILDPRSAPGVHLALSWLGCARAEVVGGYEAAALGLISFLRRRGLWLAVAGVWGAAETDEPDEAVLDGIGRRLGCLSSGGAVNSGLAARRLVESFASGRLGRVTLELPGESIFD
jgi:ribosome biogenesis GTPase A